MDEHAFPLTEFVGMSVSATFSGSSGIMSTSRLELSYPICFPGQVSGRNFSQGERYVTFCSHMQNTLVQHSRCTLQIRNPVVCDKGKSSLYK